jgi:hypothetical protein
VLDLILEHIHILHSLETSHLMVSQRKISELQGFETNNESRPIGVFVGFNHFRETVIFGAVLMYDEMFESFKWLFETFLKAHNGKQPKAIYIDQDSSMGRAVKEVFIDSGESRLQTQSGPIHSFYSAIYKLSNYNRNSRY